MGKKLVVPEEKKVTLTGCKVNFQREGVGPVYAEIFGHSRDFLTMGQPVTVTLIQPDLGPTFMKKDETIILTGAVEASDIILDVSTIRVFEFISTPTLKTGKTPAHVEPIEQKKERYSKPMFYALLLPEFRRVAEEKGYCLAIHGSMARDMDILCVPWTDEAVPADDLVTAISECLQPTVFKEMHLASATDKPHGRKSYTLSILGDWFIDLAVMPLEKRKRKEPRLTNPEIYVDRIRVVNQIMEEMAARGRRFFYYDGKIEYFAYLPAKASDNVIFNDNIVEISVIEGGKYKPGFSAAAHHGRGVRYLLESFGDFINSGMHQNGSLSGGHWGYPEDDLLAINQLALQLGFITEIV